ncbi:hypothetical protein [Desulfogranum marinum]|uniref:hypothetical protein n=1 Tax=Desulfogranum marinum TaxID=453220 RepID=UPI001962ACA2|nr:hypothetical protein [Desulfogranum marinum]MBM9515159.1 hypothetical protein [Desulfogranum marinum]
MDFIETDKLTMWDFNEKILKVDVDIYTKTHRGLDCRLVRIGSRFQPNQVACLSTAILIAKEMNQNI